MARSGWAITSLPISVSTIFCVSPTAYINATSTGNRVPINVIENEAGYIFGLSAASAVDGMSYLVVGK